MFERCEINHIPYVWIDVVRKLLRKSVTNCATICPRTDKTLAIVLGGTLHSNPEIRKFDVPQNHRVQDHIVEESKNLGFHIISSLSLSF
jgi:hypothetical protein